MEALIDGAQSNAAGAMDAAIAESAREQINTLFAAHRIVKEQERSAYLRGPDQDYIFEQLVNGFWRGAMEETIIVKDLDDAVDRSVRAIAERFPDHGTQQVVWRIEPEVSRHPPTRASRKYGVPAVPAHFVLYMRLVATPLGI